MSKEIKVFLDYLSSQTGLDIKVVAHEMELALETVVSKNQQYSEDTRIKVQIDPDNGDLEMYRIWTIIANDSESINPAYEIHLDDALKLSAEASAGEEIFESLPIDGLGRIAAAQAKQLFHRILRDGQTQKQKEQYANRVGEIVHGKVKRANRDFLIVELGENADGIIYKQDIIPREVYRIDDKIKAEIIGTETEYRNAVVQLSRTSKQFLQQQFFTEVPEINEGSIEIKAIARDPGSRAKIAVKSNDKRVDPIGACIGMRGTRVRAVSEELNGERIDIILWDDNPAKMAINALSPGEINKITLDEETKTMELEIEQDQLAQIIGRNGQNIKLASELLQWTLNIKKDDHSDDNNPLSLLCNELDIDTEIAEVLVREGYTSSLTITQSNPNNIAMIDEFDDDIAQAIYQRAQDQVLELSLQNPEPKTNIALSGFGGLTPTQAEQLKNQSIHTQEDLAELDVDELQEIIELNYENAAKLIMLAREPWFQDNNSETDD